MRILSLWQPWATFVAKGYKTVETRSWTTPFRGPIAIHAAKRHLPPLTEVAGVAARLRRNDKKQGRTRP